MPNKGWEHLGDRVYAKYDGFGMLLHANSHIDPTDRIYLEHSVFKSLVEFQEKERSMAKALSVIHTSECKERNR